jgi:hypothetical protein
MLWSEDRHEPLAELDWDEDRARSFIQRIVSDTERRFEEGGWWPMHPQDDADPKPGHTLYFGAAGVVWALRYLRACGAATTRIDFRPRLTELLQANRMSMERTAGLPFPSYLMGDTPILLLAHWDDAIEGTADALAALIESNLDSPERELMWGAPGTMLAAWFMHQRTAAPVWADLFRAGARKLWSQLQWSPQRECHYWVQELYGGRSTYIDAVHGFVGTAVPLIHGRELLDAQEWDGWRQCIVNTVERTAHWDDDLVNWRARLDSPADRPMLMQYCHGAPGFVISLADFPGPELDRLLRAAGESVWRAGPLRKGSNLCHGTGGNGYAFLKLHARFNEDEWLDRARRFAMHGIEQTEKAFETHGRLRYSLWTGDLGFAIYLWDCIRAGDRYPTLDVFFD